MAGRHQMPACIRKSGSQAQNMRKIWVTPKAVAERQVPDQVPDWDQSNLKDKE